MIKNKTSRLTIVILLSLVMQSCAGLIIGAGVGMVSVAHDRRTLGTQVDDRTLTGRVSTALADDPEIKEQTGIVVQVFNGSVLLVGQAPTNTLIQKAEQLVSPIKNINKIHNQIRLGTPISASTIANDTWLASKVKTKLLADKRIDGLHVEIEVENGEVFLMGLATQEEAEIATDITRNVSGVKQVVKVFEYL
ncbi:division/outer membrane stress-associated lipid-binding lipoprotein [Paraglaciecola marina]|uniref:division/outer membrane stress-associated lipid-binding lipoprotein n=1 Tax=Paraglaciecola marina TaxID=2500157 RepID=UPI0010610F00|nr:division/outer membrane stress-associated lipid-binding lipoprotein [Paraglaciecola marina]